MTNLYNDILIAKKQSVKLLAILIDPDKVDMLTINVLTNKINQSPANYVFVGGSTYSGNQFDEIIVLLKTKINVPIIIFPGHYTQISSHADGLLFLNLISGRNPDYLIEQQIKSVPLIKKTNLETIATAYILVDSGTITAVARVSQTSPMPVSNPQHIVQTAQAGELMGNKLIYLEAGSGANNAIPQAIINQVSSNVEIPLIIGGGIRSLAAIKNAHNSGADLVVIGTAFEKNNNFFEK